MATTKNTTKKVEDKPITRVMITLPRERKGEENFVTASVNGKCYKIRKGEAVEVPVEVAEVIENSFAAEDFADAFVEKVSQ